MIFYKAPEEIDKLRESNQLVGKTLGEVSKWMKEGVNTIKIDSIAEEFIRDHGAIPGFKGYKGFPNTLCISINDMVVHGIPSEA
jgi:methionyl aminopeptidase